MSISPISRPGDDKGSDQSPYDNSGDYSPPPDDYDWLNQSYNNKPKAQISKAAKHQFFANVKETPLTDVEKQIEAAKTPLKPSR